MNSSSELMYKLISEFPDQLSKGLEIADACTLNQLLLRDGTPQKVDNVVIFGMGGSAFGGELFKDYIFTGLCLPLIILRSYDIPPFITENSLVIICSYSGNTEETLSAAEKCMATGAHLVAVSSGGELEKLAQKSGFDFIKIPGGQPPRASFGYTFIQILAITHFYGLIPCFREEIKFVVSYLKKNQASIQKLAKSLAGQIDHKLCIIYAPDILEAVALRWKQQINENAKILSWLHVFPEMNHNEIVGWEYPNKANENLFVLLLRTPEFENSRTNLHGNFLRDQIKSKLSDKSFVEIIASTGKLSCDFFYLIHLGDWLSFEIAQNLGVDPIEVQIINRLKSELAKQV